MDTVQMGVFESNGHDYAPYVSALNVSVSGQQDEDAGWDRGDIYHPNFTSWQRSISVTMGRMPLETAMQLSADLRGDGEKSAWKYPDLYDGICTRNFYSTQIDSAVESFTPGGVYVNNIRFTLNSIKEATIDAD